MRGRHHRHPQNQVLEAELSDLFITTRDVELAGGTLLIPRGSILERPTEERQMKDQTVYDAMFHVRSGLIACFPPDSYKPYNPASPR